MSEEWLSITDAAGRLTAIGDRIDRSTLSRYVKQHAEALPKRPDGKTNLVEIGAIRAHRAENIRIRAMPAELRPEQTSRPGQTGQTEVPRFAGSQADGAARKAQADASLRELDLAKRLGQTTLVAEVDQAGREAVALMQSSFDRALESDAASFSVKYGWDERTVRIALKAHARRGLDVFNREILGRIDVMSSQGRDQEDEKDEA